ncbi:GUN4 domain-containing protein [Nostoc sp. UCD121]|nr:GUN4 domain-containing protein [Nostoc sp. UCD120]MBC1278238.1 GUN4 domain-containing protein [Nostoc sp. UCD121]MBC1294502.1 GUN4 domain-containing protein [Nostoc sp. UCD122]
MGKGVSEAKISADGNGIFGKRKTSAQSDDFFLLRIDHEQMLISLLKTGKWKDADRVTGTLMLKISCQEQDGWLNSESIKRFPCQDISKIN